jgi:multiple sugar transport system substrate-binding protein
MSNFQIVVLGIFTTLILVGVGIFAAFGGLLGNAGVGKVVIWGTQNAESMSGIIDALHGQDKSFESVSYVYKKPASYASELLNAMAAGQGPDLIMLDSDELQSFADKVFTIPYKTVSQSTFLASYVDGGQIFLTSQGALALPFTVDPLLMYWNRDLFAGAGLASPPQFWNDFITIAPKITSLDTGSQLKRSAVALGEWRNIANAKAILSALIMQAGDPIVLRTAQDVPTSVFGSTPTNETTGPAESALRFYTEFANPSKTSYSWNRSLPQAQDAFAAGTVAVYFGFASENNPMQARNPNLRFGVSVLPQIEGRAGQVTYGHFTGLAIPRTAANAQGALTIAQKMTAPDASAYVAQTFDLPPVRRDTVVDTKASAAKSVFMQSALIARSWLDPQPAETDIIFQTMIESVASGKAQPAEAVANAAATLSQLFPGQ